VALTALITAMGIPEIDSWAEQLLTNLLCHKVNNDEVNKQARHFANQKNQDQ